RVDSCRSQNGSSRSLVGLSAWGRPLTSAGDSRGMARRAARHDRLADQGTAREPSAASTTGGGNEMNRTVVTIALAAAIAVVALAAASGPARATYPGATNGRLAFGIRIDNNTDVYSVRPDGQDLRRLTTDPGFDACAAYSADVTQIAFTSRRTGTSQVYVMNADGSGQTQLTFDSQPKDQVPDWSPDGSEIAYLADTHGISDIVNPSWGDIWVMNADGSNQHTITHNAP